MEVQGWLMEILNLKRYFHPITHAITTVNCYRTNTVLEFLLTALAIQSEHESNKIAGATKQISRYNYYNG